MTDPSEMKEATVSGWNYIVHLYRPRSEILNGKWSFPQAQSVQ